MPTQSQARTSQPPMKQRPIKQTLPVWNVPPALEAVIDEVLFAVLRPKFCDVCRTFGLTYKDVSTNTRYCLECLEAACCEPLPELPPDPALMAAAAGIIAECRDRRKAA